MSVKIKDLEFSYFNEKTLKGISANLNKGEFISVIGPNGTGKSTLIKCMNGILKAQQGDLSIDNIDINKLNHREIAKLISYVPQSSSSMFNINVFDMVLLGRRPYMTWHSRKKDKEIALKALQSLNIEKLALKPFNELSGGQKQKVIIARALAQETDIVILDEPISNLDIRHQIEVMEVLKKLVKTKGITAISVIHDLNVAIKYSDKVMILSEGKTMALGKPYEVITEENISKVYGVEVKCARLDDDLIIVPHKIKCS